jgi:hypothetical protein
METRAITSGQEILLPANKHRKQRTVTVAVNSRDRNYSADYNSNDFRWTFRRPLKDVVSVELVNGCIPADLYNISSAWGSFTFGEQGSAATTVTLTPGVYTQTTIATELALQLNNIKTNIVSYTNIYSVQYDISAQRITVSTSGTSPYTFYWYTSPLADAIDSNTGALVSVNTPARLLGFDWADITSVGGKVQAPYRLNLDYCIKNAYLYINAENSVELNRVELGAGRRDCFHIIFMDEAKAPYYTLTKDLHTPIYYSSPAPISRISTLRISLRDESYRVLDLGMRDFTLVFEFTVLD